jgi:hypothetical protein
VKVSDAQARGGLAQWRSVFNAAMRAQSQNALGQAYLLVGKDHVLRMDAPASSNPIALDDFATARAQLPEMARALVEAGGREVLRTFLNESASPYIPQSQLGKQRESVASSSPPSSASSSRRTATNSASSRSVRG